MQVPQRDVSSVVEIQVAQVGVVLRIRRCGAGGGVTLATAALWARQTAVQLVVLERALRPPVAQVGRVQARTGAPAPSDKNEN